MTLLRACSYWVFRLASKMLSFDYTTELIFIGLNFRKPSFKTWSSNLRFYFIALVYVVEIYGNVRAMFLTQIQIRQLIINICHLFGVFMVIFVVKILKFWDKIYLKTKTTIRYLHIFYAADTFDGLINTIIRSTSNFKLDVELEQELAKKYSRISRHASIT